MKKISAIVLMGIVSFVSKAQYLDYEWSFPLGTSGRDICYDVQTDASGNVYQLGMFEGLLDFDPGAGVEEILDVGSTDIYVAKYSSAGDLIWAKTIGGGAWDQAAALKLDNSGGLFVGGTFRSIPDFDPGSGTVNVSSNGDFDAFLLKLNTDGEYQWVKTFGGSGRESCLAIDIDDSGNLYTTGYFEGTVDFDPSSNVDSHTSAGDLDIFLAKYDSNGDFQWANTFGSIGVDAGRAVKVDSDNNILLGGSFSDTVDFEPGLNSTNIVSEGGVDGFTAKYNSDGEIIWVNGLGGSSDDIIYSFAMDGSNNLVITGWFQDTLNLMVNGVNEEKVSKGGEDILLAKMDTDGNFLWVNAYGGIAQDRGFDVAIDDEERIFFTGHFEDTITFDGVNEEASSGIADVYIATLNNDGSFVASTSFGGTSSDKARAICVDNNGGVYNAGSFEGTVDFNPGLDTNSFVYEGQYDAYIVKFDVPLLGLETELENDIELSLYPNPSSDFVTVKLGDPTNARMRILDVSGKEISRFNLTNQAQVTLDVSAYQNGIYFVNITKDNQTHTMKLVKR